MALKTVIVSNREIIPSNIPAIDTDLVTVIISVVHAVTSTQLGVTFKMWLSNDRLQYSYIT